MRKVRYVRFAVGLAVLVGIVASMQMHGFAVGSLCVFCPVGFAQLGFASGTVPWHLVPAVVALLLIAILLGRAFCAWVCPTGLLKNIFGGRAPRGVSGQTGCAAHNAECVQESERAQGVESSGACASTQGAEDARPDKDALAPGAACGPCAACGTGGGSNLRLQGLILIVLLLVSFAVGFPVFCLLCPIGLALGTLYAASRAFVLWQPGWELLVFPLMLLAEVFLFRRWCSALCPIGFFFGLAAKLRTKLKFGMTVRAKTGTCRSGEGCGACGVVCPENIDVPAATAHELEDCTLCLECVHACPTRSIKVGTMK